MAIKHVLHVYGVFWAGGCGLRLQIPDVSPASVAGIFRDTTDADEKSGICNLRPRPTGSEDTIYIDAGRESLNQYIFYTLLTLIYVDG